MHVWEAVAWWAPQKWPGSVCSLLLGGHAGEGVLGSLGDASQPRQLGHPAPVNAPSLVQGLGTAVCIPWPPHLVAFPPSTAWFCALSQGGVCCHTPPPPRQSLSLSPCFHNQGVTLFLAVPCASSRHVYSHGVPSQPGRWQAGEPGWQVLEGRSARGGEPALGPQPVSFRRSALRPPTARPAALQDLSGRAGSPATRCGDWFLRQLAYWLIFHSASVATRPGSVVTW